MISRLTLRNFKRFREQTFELADSVVLAGPNNAGKSTLLQAIATWKLGLDRWVAQREGGAGRQALGSRHHAGRFHGRAAPRDEPVVGGPEGHRAGRHGGHTAAHRDRRGGRGRRRAVDVRNRVPVRQPGTGLRASPGGEGSRPRDDSELPAGGGAGAGHRSRPTAVGHRARRAAARSGHAGSAGRPGTAGRDPAESPVRDRRAGRRGLAGTGPSRSRALPHPHSRTSCANTGRRVTAGRSTSRTPGAAHSRCC